MSNCFPLGTHRRLSLSAILTLICLIVGFSPSSLHAQLDVAFTDIAEPGCYGLPGGNVRAVAVGGTGPYTFVWSDGTEGDLLTKVVAGTYSVTVTDATASFISRSITILQPELLVVSFETQECELPLKAMAIPDGGFGPYMYRWSTGETSSMIMVNPEVEYCVTVTDQNDCGAVNCVTLEYNPLEVNVEVNDISCPGEEDGSLTATPIGGTPPLSYEWSNGANTQSITDLAPGTYTVTVTDDKGCTATANGNVAPQTAIEIALGKNDPTCVGETDGSVTSSVAGGTPPYTYAWSTGATTANLGSLGPGTYTLTITDANGCTDINSISLEYQSEISIGVAPTPETCPDANDGFLTVTVNNGVLPYTYEWSNGGTTQVQSGVAPGTYSVTVTDAVGCQDTASATVLPAPDLVVEVEGTDVSICEGANGSATVTSVSGTGPFFYLWSTGDTTPTIEDLAAGTYTVTVTTPNQCEGVGMVTIGEPPAVIVEATGTEVLCPGDETGTVSAEVTGGTAPFTFVWNTGATTQTIANLPAGTYTVTVTDAAGCTDVDSWDINEAPALTVNTFGTDIVCGEGSTGSAMATVTGGTEPFSFEWSNGSETQAIAGVGSGTYTVTVTDALGCTGEGMFTIRVIDDLEITFTAEDVDCPGSENGTATAMGSGGDAPYTFEWSTGVTGATITGLAPGTYSVTMTDANDCTAEGTVEIGEPEDITATLVPVDPLCFGDATGSISLTAAGGTPPYTFAWSNGETTQDISDLPAGDYSVTITDANDCFIVSNATVSEPPAIEIDGLISDILCTGDENGAVDITVSGGTPPYTFAWSTGQTTEDLDNLIAGAYTVTVTDANDCTAMETFTVVEPPLLNLAATLLDVSCNGESDGAISITVGGGTPPYTFEWSNGATTEDLVGVPVGTYTVIVTDANGCIISATGTISEPPALICTINQLSDVVLGADGSLEVVAEGGVGPYTYLWSNGDTTAVIDGLDGGVFSVTVTDAVGCTTICDFNLIALAGLGDFVWEDINKDGLQDMDEPGIAGVRVRLKDDEGSVIDSTLTDMNGFYSFVGLEAGTYSVQFVGPEGFNTTQLDAGGDDALDSDADPDMAGMTATVTLSPGEFNPTLDAGFYNPPSGAITDPCHCLNNATNELNGQFSEEVLIRSYPGETWTIIEQENMFLMESPAPPAAPLPVPVGTVILESEVPGEYLFEFRLVDEFSYTVLATNGFDTLGFTNTCIYPTLNVDNFPGPEICISDDPIVLTASPSIPGTVRFYLNDEEITVLDPAQIGLGEYTLRAEFTPDDEDECIATEIESLAIVNTCFAKIGDFVWEDIMRNGIQDEGEPGIPGVPVSVTEVGVENPYTDATTTDENGMYMFLVPPDRTYQVTFGQPEGLNPVMPNTGADDTIDSDADQMTLMSQEVSVADGEVNLTIDAGFYFRPEAEIGDPCTCLNNATNELDGQFQEIVEVRSYPGETWTIIEQENMFLLDSPAPPAAPIPLPLGTTMVETDEPGLYEIRFKLVDEFMYRIVVTNGLDTLSYSSVCAYPTVNVEQLPPLEACVADDPIVLNATPSVPGTTVFYLNNEPISVFDPSTLEVGSYEFRVEFTPETFDVCIVTIVEQIFVLEDCLAKIGDFVWDDRDHDGVQDMDESGIEGVKVTVTETGVEDPYIDMTTTDANGMYMFLVPPGSYKVTFEQPAGYIPTLQNAGGDDTVDSDSDPDMLMTQSVTVADGEMNLTLDAGFYIPSSVAIADPCTCLNNATNEDNGQFSEILSIQADPGRTWTILSNAGMYSLDSPAPPAAPIPVPVGTQLVEVSPGVYEYEFILVDELLYSTIATNGIDTLNISNICEYPTINVEEFPGADVCTGDEPVPLSANPSVPGVVRFYLDGVEITELDPSSLELGTYELLVEFTPDDPEECLATILQEIVVNNECLAKVGDLVWYDRNENGIQDAGENGIGGVEVSITELNSDNPFTATTTTDGTGMYMFQVPPGDFKITFGQPEFYEPTIANAGSDDALDSDMDPVNLMTPPFTIEDGEMNFTFDAGFTRECINITNPGAIGYDQYLCGPGNDAAPFVSLAPASGGVGEIEYLWMYSTEDGPFNQATWTLIPNSNAPTYDPGVLYETTRFARCARREGCPGFLETTIVTVLVGDEAVAEIFGQSTICVGEVATYEAVGISEGAEVSWNFGPGAQPATATGAEAHVKFTSFGTFTIELTVTENDCTSSITKRIVVTNNPAICGEGFVINTEVTNEENRELLIDWQIKKGNLLDFTVEYSEDGQNFMVLGPNNEPAGFTAEDLQYMYLTVAPKMGRNFYRVKMSDTQGNEWYSNTEEVVFFSESKLALLYPNPARNQAILEIFESFDEDVTIELVSSSGQLIQTHQVVAGSPRIALDLTDVATGVYLLRVRFGKTNIKALRLVKY
ncbi:SdrD B-like domain-containing protein [Flavilitoribacter nigricans]|uniref:PKD domain-containing protein n=1 Tax=Flavilitoribacter nigricans (strain ATCC 23147 / DSM 23189 / NBRC 102662 / NCIMB 1420 / SS-2) TaxID=1122177 RepID=A0A2D0NBB0_FLAN2|nr:SdrD B-like domain-containing protein [Flavilitoribacter nigricans]PHN05775.1 hypothetical protein CRP01_14980 [Flavilitoribacter nigricans DSM 23189 = NBRC 102662]